MRVSSVFDLVRATKILDSSASSRLVYCVPTLFPKLLCHANVFIFKSQLQSECQFLLMCECEDCTAILAHL